MPAPHRAGTALSAAEPCTSSNTSPQLNSCFALLRCPASVPHEPTVPTSTCLPAPARTESLCRISLQPHSRPPLHPLSATIHSRTARAGRATCARVRVPLASLEILGILPFQRVAGRAEAVSKPREFHPEPLSEPCVNLSIYTAPIIQPRTQ